MKIPALALSFLALVSCQEKAKQETSHPVESTKTPRPTAPATPVTPDAPSDSSSTTKTPRPPSPPAGAPAEPTEAEMKSYEGLTLEDAEAKATSQGFKHRVVERDGQMLPTTRDLRMDRLNFKVKDGKVIGVTKG